jgi:hypothetical protein
MDFSYAACRADVLKPDENTPTGLAFKSFEVMHNSEPGPFSLRACADYDPAKSAGAKTYRTLRRARLLYPHFRWLRGPDLN